MDNIKFNSFISCLSDAFCQISSELANLKFIESEKENIKRDKSYFVVVGVVSNNDKGRILMETGETFVNFIAESFNGEPDSNMTDIYLSIAEFANMFCGRAVTLLNNKFKGSQNLRLTPPAVFFGKDMEVTTPDTISATTYLKCMRGVVSLNIQLEEV